MSLPVVPSGENLWLKTELPCGLTAEEPGGQPAWGGQLQDSEREQEPETGTLEVQAAAWLQPWWQGPRYLRINEDPAAPDVRGWHGLCSCLFCWSSAGCTRNSGAPMGVLDSQQPHPWGHFLKYDTRSLGSLGNPALAQRLQNSVWPVEAPDTQRKEGAKRPLSVIWGWSG